jgi:pimeloyl-ACP methyl ester carboxylesterase
MSGDSSFTIQLPGGRRLGAAVFGDPEGIPVLYNSGLPTCRQEAGIFAGAGARAAGVKLISLERPGYGLSDPSPGQALSQWPDDVVRVADALGLDRFAVVGLSGGGPFALACAARLPDRVSRVGVVSGLGPLDRATLDEPMPASQLFRMLRFMAPRPRLAAAVFGFLALLGRTWGDLALHLLTLQMPPLDRAVCRRDGIWQGMRRHMLTEPFRNGVGRAVEEVGLYAASWGFRLEEIRTEVHLWHGERDAHVPVAMGRFVARSLPRCTFHLVPEAGHLLIADHAEEIFRALIA